MAAPWHRLDFTFSFYEMAAFHIDVGKCLTVSIAVKRHPDMASLIKENISSSSWRKHGGVKVDVELVKELDPQEEHVTLGLA